MQGILDRIESYGAKLVALTPQLPEYSRTMVERHDLGFGLLSDQGNEYAAKLGIRFQVPDDLKAVYQSVGIDLEKYNGDASWTLPMPGRLVIDTSGVVRAVSVDPDYTKRPEPETVLDDLDAL